MNRATLKKNIRDITVWKISVFGIAWLYRLLVRKKGPLVRIVVFHDVPDAVWFESMIATLAKKYALISPREFYEAQHDTTRINVLVTFDDGYASWVDVATPILKKYNCTALFFVSSGLLQGAHDVHMTESFMRTRLHISPKRALSWEGARALLHSGHSLGGHGATHADLTQCMRDDRVSEIANDKVAIEVATGEMLTDFAYPFGTTHHVNREVAEDVLRAGYSRAYTATSRFVYPPYTLYIPRMCIENATTPTQLERWVEGAYDLFDMMKTLCVR